MVLQNNRWEFFMRPGKKRSMRSVLCASVALLALLFSESAPAQNIYRVGALAAGDQFMPAFEGFKAKMAELGFVEGKNINYEVQNGRGDLEVMRKAAQKFVQERLDVIVTSSTTATVPVAKATEGTDIPVVFLAAGNPLKFVKSYASSGNNLTGISTSSIELTGKRMELLKELVPGVKGVISINNTAGENYQANLKATRQAAKGLGLRLFEVNVRSGDELVKKAGKIFTRKLGDAIFYPPDANLDAVYEKISYYAIKARLPSVSANITNVQHGALATYAADYFVLGQQAAVLASKILKGTKPADLPIEPPSDPKLVINLKTAAAIGLKIPKEILLRANEMIE